MGEYTGLPGVRGGTIKPRGKHIARTVAGVMAILQKGRIASAAGDDGAVTVWRDDEGSWRCEFSRWRSPVDNQTFDTKAAVQRWLVEWMPKLQRASVDSGRAE
jgi:hypothetical protein